ncbi:hypothetical protein [Aestuariivita boseongensis]|uniref:hypothetical protein n=1 Tax=Aestuariivita boseongensis TaxID=1470562 RepID=UPI00067FF02C|nr:hypothetical protein [Aestuariivita boseongensis]
MGKAVLSVVFLIIGLIIGLLGSGFVGGAAMGVGVATGASSGICMTLQAAQEEGLINDEQVDQVLNRAAANFAELSGDAAPSEVVGAASDCASVLEKLRKAQ